MGSPELTVQIDYIRNGRIIARARVVGRLLTPILPCGLVLEPSGSGDFVIYEPADRCLAGQLTLPLIVEREFSFVDLLIPTNGCFDQDDLRLLWEAGAELASWRSARTAVARDDGTFGAPELVGRDHLLRDWRSLSICAQDAIDLLARWPTELVRRSVWMPVGSPGGVEDVPVTEREAERRGHILAHNDSFTITQSARWLGNRREVVSVGVSALALAVAQLVHSSVPRDQIRLLNPLLDPIAAVARVATPASGRLDPDFSSQPAAFVSFVASCMRTIAELQSSKRGAGVIPLLDTDELYEAWLAVEVRDALDERLGSRVAAASDALAAWQHDDILYQLWVKPAIDGAGRQFGSASYRAIVAAALTPDLVLSASRDEETALHVLDAKSWAQLFPEDALTQSAKYLYGLRRVSDPGTVPALTGVDLVTCAWPPSVAGADLARVQVMNATPTKGVAALRGRINEILETLVAAIEARERLASEY